MCTTTSSGPGGAAAAAAAVADGNKEKVGTGDDGTWKYKYAKPPRTLWEKVKDSWDEVDFVYGSSPEAQWRGMTRVEFYKIRGWKLPEPRADRD